MNRQVHITQATDTGSRRSIYEYARATELPTHAMISRLDQAGKGGSRFASHQEGPNGDQHHPIWNFASSGGAAWREQDASASINVAISTDGGISRYYIHVETRFIIRTWACKK